MKQFSFQSIDFPLPPDIYTESNLPNWLFSRDFQWFRDDHVLTLEVGQSIETDFTRITRIS